MHKQGHVLRNTVTGEVALRSHFDADNPALVRLAWIVSHPMHGPRMAPASDVAGDDWVDLFVPEEGEENAG